jgi:diguanylate cyclase (GGDEF)-like protein
MNGNDSTVGDCPLGAEHCSVLEELGELRRRVSELSELIRTDTLTGLFNFRFFLQALEQEMERTRRTGQPTGLIMLDLDHFKLINDSWGHEVGNRALVHVAKIMFQSLRKLDSPCRYGGEEFAIVLADTDLADSIRVAERLRKRIESSPLEVEGSEISLRASFGLDVFVGAGNVTADEMVKQVDSFLYQAKKEGRNRVCHPPLQRLDVAVGVGGEERRILWSRTPSDRRKKGK